VVSGAQVLRQRDREPINLPLSIHLARVAHRLQRVDREADLAGVPALALVAWVVRALDQPSGFFFPHRVSPLSDRCSSIRFAAAAQQTIVSRFAGPGHGAWSSKTIGASSQACSAQSWVCRITRPRSAGSITRRL